MRAFTVERPESQMSSSASPAAVVQKQLDAYNAKDVSAWLSTYAPDAQQFTLHGERLAAG